MQAHLIEGLGELKLKYWGHALSEDLVSMKDQEREIVTKYLNRWIAKEKSERRTQMIQTRIKSAKFRRLQTVENFDFRHSKTTEKIEKTYLTLHASIARDSLPSTVFTGHAGTGAWLCCLPKRTHCLVRNGRRDGQPPSARAKDLQLGSGA